MISPIHIIHSVQKPKERGTDKGCQVYSGAFVLLTGQSNAMIIFFDSSEDEIVYCIWYLYTLANRIQVRLITLRKYLIL